MDETTRDRSPWVVPSLDIPGDDEGVAIGWSCDGQGLAVVRGSGSDVWKIDPSTGGIHHAFSTKGKGNDSPFVEWSPVDPNVLAQTNGETIALIRCNRSISGFTSLWTSQQPMAGLHHRLSFSPSGRRIALATEDRFISIIDAASGNLTRALPCPFGAAGVWWSPDGDHILALGPSVGAAVLRTDASAASQLIGHGSLLPRWAAWSRDGTRVCLLGENDPAIRVWSKTGHLQAVLEGHTDRVLGIEFSPDGRLLYSVSSDSTLRCWQTATWQCVDIIGLRDAHTWIGGLAANPIRPVLARRTNDMKRVDFIQIDVERLLGTPSAPRRTYANAKVVLLGDTGVGKSGLGLVLTRQPYQPTDSTHARQVFTFDLSEVALPDGGTESREILLWDLAGQPGYRLIHQLHLAEAAVALVVFDARSEIDPFAGVHYWMRALRHYRSATGPHGAPAPTILVAARVDRGGIPASPQRIAALCDDLGITIYLETSAKEGRNIPELAAAIRGAIDWDALPRSVSTDLFESIKRFLIDEKEADRELDTADDLYHLFVSRHPDLGDEENLPAAFTTCIRLLEGRDLVRRLSFGGFVLLRPELLDAYASALIDAARDQPDGLGYIPEDHALAGNFRIPSEVRLQGHDEQLLLIAMVEELLRHDLALRQLTEGDVDLVFPSQFTIDRPDAPDSTSADVVFRFDGAINTVYATLTVRLSHVAAYQRQDMWRNACTYRAKVGGACGLRVHEVEEGRGELTIFFDERASEETRFLFEEYVHTHLSARALPGSVVRERVFTCKKCDYRLPADLVRRRQSRGDTSMRCPDCEDVVISLLDREDRLDPAPTGRKVREMNASADAGRDRATATAIIRGKELAGDYDVFLSYNTKDRAAVADIADRLRREGILPWFDRDNIAPGTRWSEELQRQIAACKTGAVFIGPDGLGQWQTMEIEALVSQHAKRGFPVIPVLLTGVAADFNLPIFLSQFQAVDFRRTDPKPFPRLLWAITGERRSEAVLD